MREHWSSRLGFVLAAAGSAIGLGTLWKFPYVTGENGGGIFVFVYIIFTLFIGIPLFLGEILLGRRAQRGAVGVFSEISGKETSWRIIGWLGVLSSFLILSFYCVVAGWGLSYFIMSLNQIYMLKTPAEIEAIFPLLSRSGDISLFWGFLFLLMTFAVVYQGVKKGIEFWSKILTFTLFIVLFCLVGYALTLEGLGKALHFLFSTNLHTLKTSSLIEALGLSFFTLSLAQGILLTYGSYLRPSEDLPKTSWIIGLMVIAVAILTVLMIYPVIFTFDLKVEEGAGLIFKTLPVLFASLPGSIFISTLFFGLFTLTAITSSVALLEVIAANLMDLFQMTRHRSVLWAGGASFIVGVPSALAGSHELFPTWQAMYGLNFFSTIDALVSIWLLPLGGFLLALYLGWSIDKKLLKAEFSQGSRWSGLYPLWFFSVRWLAPLAILLIFLQNGGFL